MSASADRIWFGACAAIYLAVATRLTDGLGRTQFDNSAFAHFFDYQAEALLRGDLTLEKDVIGLEAFVIDGQDQLYFGLFPSLLRLPVEMFTDRFFGSLTLVSSFVAWALFVSAAWALTDRIVAASAGSRSASWLTRVWKVGVALGTPVWVLAGPVWVFSEAIMWGVASCVWFQYRLYRELEAMSRANQMWLAAALLLVVLNRPTLGLGCVAVTGVVVARRAWRARSMSIDELFLTAITAVGGVVLILPNLIRFSRPFGPPMQAQGLSMFDAHRMRMLEYSGGDYVDLRYLPSNLLAYLRPDGLWLSGRFPFVEAPAHIPTVFGGAIHDITYRTPSLLASTPILVFPAVLGIWTVLTLFVRRQSDARVPHVAVLASAGAPAAAALLIWGFIAPRYLADFVPLLLPFAVLGIARLHGSDNEATPAARVGRAAVSAFAVWSVLVSGSLAVAASYQTGYDGDIAEYVDLQGRSDVWETADRRDDPAAFEFERNAPPPAGAIVVLGDCAAAYFSTGEQVDPWLDLAYGPNDFRRMFDVSTSAGDATVELAELASVEPTDDGSVDAFSVVLAVRGGSVGIDLVDVNGTVRYDFDGVQPGDSFTLAVTSDPVRKVLTFEVDGTAVGYGHVFTRSLYGPSGQQTWFSDAGEDGRLNVVARRVEDPC